MIAFRFVSTTSLLLTTLGASASLLVSCSDLYVFALE